MNSPDMLQPKLEKCLAAVVAAALLTGSTGCGLIQRPAARIAGVRVQDVGLTNATMLFDVEVKNPYSVPLPLSNVDYALSSRGQRFLAGEADVQGEVPALGSRTLGVPVRISYLELINAVKDARPGGAIPYTADLGLSVNTPALGPLRVPMSTEGQLDIPTGPGLLERLKDLAR